MLIELALVLVYICVLVVKMCGVSSEACATFGFGTDGKGVEGRLHKLEP